jgi:bZIP transcription factor
MMSGRLERGHAAPSCDQTEEAQASTAPFENLCLGSSLTSDLRPLRPEAAASATIAPRVPYWPQGPVQIRTFSAAGRHPAAALAEFALAAAPAWELPPLHEQDSAAGSMAQVRASSSTSARGLASEQDIALRHGDHIKPAAAPVKREWSATPLKGDSKPTISKKERNRISAHNSRIRKQEYLQQLEQEVAAYRAAAHHGFELLNEQWTALNSFLRWFCTSGTRSQEQCGTFADENCTLWLPLGDVASNEAAAVAAQHNSTVVCFTGVAEIASLGRQHFFNCGTTSDMAAAAVAAAAAAAAAAVTSDDSGQTSTMMNIDSQGDALSGLHMVVDRQQMYTRCSSTTADSSSSTSNVNNLSYVSAQFMCSRHVTYTSAVHGAAACTFAADCNSGQQRLISVNLLYDTCAMARLVAATTRYHARSSYTTSSTDSCTSISWSY